MIKIQKNKAYAQVLEILNHIKLEDYYKLPKEIIRALEVNKDEDTKFKYNKEKDFLEQEMLSETKLILAIFFKRYWATDDQKAKIRTYEVNKIVAIEEEKKKIYPQNVITDKIVEPRLGKYDSSLAEDEDDTLTTITEKERKGLRNAGIVALIFIAVIVVACIPAGMVVVLGLDEVCEEMFYHAVPVAIALIVFGIAFIVIERKNPSSIKYIFSFMAIIDLLSILPFYLPFFFNVDLRVLRSLRLVRLLRIFKANRYTYATCSD